MLLVILIAEPSKANEYYSSYLNSKITKSIKPINQK